MNIFIFIRVGGITQLLVFIFDSLKNRSHSFKPELPAEMETSDKLLI